MSTALYHSLRKFALCLALCALPFTRATAGLTPAPVVLWTDGLPRGQWVPFGEGMLDSVALSEEKGLRMIVDWSRATYGVGARFAVDPKTTGAKPLPKLASFHRLQLEARSESEGRVKLTVELVVQQNDRAIRSNKDQAKGLTAAWQKLEFVLPADFPGLNADNLPNVDALRILFSNPDKTGNDTLEFRNVTLVP